MQLKTTLRNLLTAMKTGLSRFTIPTVFTVALTANWILGIMGVKWPHGVDAALLYYLTVGTLLSFVLQLWREEVASRRTVLIVNIVAHVALLADAVYLYVARDSLTLADGLSRASIITALFIGGFLISFFRERTDVASWNFTWRNVLNWIVCFLIGGVVYGGIELLLHTSAVLFGFDVDYKIDSSMAVVFTFLLPMLMFFGRTPQGEAKHDRVPVSSKFLSSVARYIMLPLVVLYVVVLYIYGLVILQTWDLPKGMVAIPVSVCMLICVIVECMLYPTRQAEGSETDNKIARYLPLAILPLLVLMTVGLVRRISDYGITIQRLYALTLNVWFYFVCIWFCVSRARRISWVAASFAAVFVATSALPVLNYANLTRHYMNSSVSSILAAAKVTDLPLTEERFTALMESLPADSAKTLHSQLKHIEENFGKEETAKYYTGYIPYSYHATETVTHHGTETVTHELEYLSNSVGYEPIPVPAGFKYMRDCYDNHASFNESDGDIVKVPIHLEWIINEGELGPNDRTCFDETVFVSISELRKHADDNPFEGIVALSKRGKFVITSYELNEASNGENELEISGYLFYNE